MIGMVLRLVPLLLLLATACQTVEMLPYAEPICEETVTVLASVNDPAPTGYAVADFIDLVGGPRLTELEYLGPPEGDRVYVEIQRDDPSTALTLELTPDLAELRWVATELVYPPGSDPDHEIPCDSRFEFAASLSVSTADGVLAELLEATISAFVDDDGAPAILGVPIVIDPDALTGSFEVIALEPADPVEVFHELWVEYPLTSSQGDVGQPRGYLGGLAVYDLGRYLALGVFHIGVFGGYELTDPAGPRHAIGRPHRGRLGPGDSRES